MGGGGCTQHTAGSRQEWVGVCVARKEVEPLGEMKSPSRYLRYTLTVPEVLAL